MNNQVKRDMKQLIMSRQSTGSSSMDSRADQDSDTGEEPTPANEQQEKESQRSKKSIKLIRSISLEMREKLRRHLSLNVNNMAAIKFKMLFFMMSFIVYHVCLVEAGWFTFYFPNLFKPKGFNELSDMITVVEERINETKDSFADAQYFWGLLQELDKQPLDTLYPEESNCADVFPLFRDLAIEYAYIDFEHYIKPHEAYREHLIEFRSEWYPGGEDSKAALPREWEQDLIKYELELKIKWMAEITNNEKFKDLREKMIEIWKNVRRSLDTSLPCLYLRYAYRQIAEDINQMALETNLKGLQEALEMVQVAYKRISTFKKSDELIIAEINEEIVKENRFTIKL